MTRDLVTTAAGARLLDDNPATAASEPDPAIGLSRPGSPPERQRPTNNQRSPGAQAIAGFSRSGGIRSHAANAFARCSIASGAQGPLAIAKLAPYERSCSKWHSAWASVNLRARGSAADRWLVFRAIVGACWSLTNATARSSGSLNDTSFTRMRQSANQALRLALALQSR